MLSVFLCSIFNLLISFIKKKRVTAKVIKSEINPLYQIPFTPKLGASISIRGNKSSPNLNKSNRVEIFGKETAWKYCEHMSWNPIRGIAPRYTFIP